ncbi:MAG: DUF421 domain-containing protein [Mycobacterium sp.]|nr:DUF421 domain-containing protein [Mycobacterium sp.]
MWFDSWAQILRVLTAGVVAYIAVVLVLRVAGKRTLAKLNAFDLVVTVAFGSTLATIFLNATVSIAEGVTALALLAALQIVAALISSHVRKGHAVMTSRPTALVTHGRFRDAALRRQRISAAEVRQAVRSSGNGDMNAVAAVVLESDGSLSVITEDSMGDHSALLGVQGHSS